MTASSAPTPSCSWSSSPPRSASRWVVPSAGRTTIRHRCTAGDPRLRHGCHRAGRLPSICALELETPGYRPGNRGPLCSQPCHGWRHGLLQPVRSATASWSSASPLARSPRWQRRPWQEGGLRFGRGPHRVNPADHCLCRPDPLLVADDAHIDAIHVLINLVIVVGVPLDLGRALRGHEASASSSHHSGRKDCHRCSGRPGLPCRRSGPHRSRLPGCSLGRPDHRGCVRPAGIRDRTHHVRRRGPFRCS